MAWIADPGQPGIGDQRDVFPRSQLFDQFSGASRFVVLMIANQWLVDLEVPEKVAGVAGVFGRNQVSGFEGFEGAQRYISKIPDRGRD
jgi:hypothetical protein